MSSTGKVALLKLSNPELDKVMGGIPLPSLTIIEGPNDSGKSVLTQQIIYGATKQNLRTRCITSETKFTDLVRQMDSLSFKVVDSVKNGQFRITELQGESHNWNVELSSLYLSVTEKFIRSDKLSNLVIIDSLTCLVTHASSEDVLKFFTGIKRIVDSDKRSIIITLHPYAFNDDMLIRIRSICDNYFKLSIQEIGGKIARSLEMKKIRGVSKDSSGFLTFQVDPAFGIKVMPFTRAKG